MLHDVHHAPNGPRFDERSHEIRHAGAHGGPCEAERDQECAQMMQHEMRPAMHEEHVLRIEVDMRLQHRIIERDTKHETGDPPRRGPLHSR